MNETVIFKPGRKSLVVAILAIGLMDIVSVAFLLMPGMDGGKLPFAASMLAITCFFVWMVASSRNKTRIVLEEGSMICTLKGHTLRLEYAEIAKVEKKFISGLDNDFVFVVLEVPSLEAKISANSNLKIFRSPQSGQIQLNTAIYDEKPEIILEAIKERIAASAPISLLFGE